MLKDLFHVEKNSTKEFWLSHFVVLVSTVCAVYLAAMAGLQTAVDFEMVQSDRNSYYLQSSLLDEFKDNTDQALKIVEDCLEDDDEYGDGGKSKKKWKYLEEKGKHDLEKFVWTAMLDSSDTFEVPSPVLTGVRRYYKLADKVIGSITNAEYGNKSWGYPYRNQSIALLKASREAKSKLIPMMQKELDRLKKRLESKGVDLNTGSD